MYAQKKVCSYNLAFLGQTLIGHQCWKALCDQLRDTNTNENVKGNFNEIVKIPPKSDEEDEPEPKDQNPNLD